MNHPIIRCSIASTLPSEAPEAEVADIQWMPPGLQNIVAEEDGEEEEMTLNVDAAAAAAVQAAFVRHKAKADANLGDPPFFDFDHENKEASGRPIEFYWGGDDPIKGGIRARVALTPTGKAKLKGKEYVRFSPQFHAPKPDRRIIGAPVNMGGLVNRAAFQRIASISAKLAGQPSNQNNTTMKALLAYLATQGLLSSAELSEESAISQISASLPKLKGELSAAQGKLLTTETELATVKATLTERDGQIKTIRATHAKSVVEAAIKAGRIPAQNETIKAKWVEAIEKDPSAEEMLPEGSATDLTGSLIRAKAPAGKQISGRGGLFDHPFTVKAKAIETERKCDPIAAIRAAAVEEPALYDSYRQEMHRITRAVPAA